MPSGGSWGPADITDTGRRPGLYANLTAAAAAAIALGQRGIVAMPVTADWGPLRVPVVIQTESDLKNNFGDFLLMNGTAYHGIEEALRGGAQKVIAYRMAGAAAAKAARILLDGSAGTAITLTALYEGARANGLTADVVTNVVDGAQKDVKISEGGVLLETFSGATNAAIVAKINATDGTGSKYVTAVAGGGTFVANVAAAAFTGGNSGLTVLTADWTAAMAALEPMLWDVFAPVGLVDTTIQASIFAWIKDLRNNGNKVFLVIGSAAAEALATAKINAATFNHEGVAYVWPGVTQDKAYKVGTVLSGANFVGRIAGLIASRGTEKSLTFANLDGVTALEKTPTNAEVKSGLTAGLLMLTSDGAGTFRVEYGINTLTTLSGTQSRQFKKIRIIRILDVVFNTLTQNLSSEYIGNIENDEDGQKTVMAAVLGFLGALAASRYIKPEYTVEVDTGQTAVSDSLFLRIGIKPVDSVDFIYVSINVG